LVFESFAFKRGVPTDADYVFDVRMLPNPHYEPELAPLTGRDQPVVDFSASADLTWTRCCTRSRTFWKAGCDALARDHRSYVTVAIGCTGGQHRSVYLVEQLAKRFAPSGSRSKRHRETGRRADEHASHGLRRLHCSSSLRTGAGKPSCCPLHCRRNACAFQAVETLGRGNSTRCAGAGLCGSTHG